MENEKPNPYPAIEEELERIKKGVAAVPIVDAPNLFPPIPGITEIPARDSSSDDKSQK